MAGSPSGVEASAIGILTRAVEMDSKERLTEALVCYQEGLKLLIEVMKGTDEERKKQHLRTKITEYMGRAEQLKKTIEKEKQAGTYHEQIHIEANSTGHGYEKLFGSFLKEGVLTEVEIEDPYVRSNHQIYNFLRLCELIVKFKCKVKKMKLVTGQDNDPGQSASQENKLGEIGNSLKDYGINFEVEFSPTLHDREIRLNNGWIIKIGRGLDIYKPTANQFSIGFCDMDLRLCHETTVDIFHKKQLQS